MAPELQSPLQGLTQGWILLLLQQTGLQRAGPVQVSLGAQRGSADRPWCCLLLQQPLRVWLQILHSMSACLRSAYIMQPAWQHAVLHSAAACLKAPKELTQDGRYGRQ